MKNESFKILIAILIVPVLIAGMISFIQNMANHEKTETEHTEDICLEAETMEKQGYVVYQTLPERIRALADSEVFGEVYEYRIDAAEAEDVAVAEEEGNEQTQDVLASMGQEGILKNVRPLLVSKTGSYAAEFAFDAASGTFTDAELIRRIEACGFTGFSEQLVKIEKIMAEKVKTYGEGYYELDMDVYSLTCQGVTFELYRVGKNSFSLQFDVNLSTCYVPERYKSLVEKVSAAGGYFLSASQIGGRTEVLTFTKDNAVADESSRTPDEAETENNNKKLILMFQKGSLSDYYMTVAGTDELNLDDEDKEILQICTAGLGKELSGQVYKRSGYGGNYRIFRAE